MDENVLFGLRVLKFLSFFVLFVCRRTTHQDGSKK
jgi:hypothetical protein